MSEKAVSSSSVAAVPDETRQVLLNDGTDVQSKVGHVAKFQTESIDLDDRPSYRTTKPTEEFVSLTVEELKSYVNNPKWKRIRWALAGIYLALILLLLAGSVYLVLTSPACPPKPNLDWFQRDIIYEIDLPTFYDANGDGIGDLNGLKQKLPYLEKNRMKSILLQSSIFNSTLGTSIQLDGKNPGDKKLDLLTLDPFVGTESDLQDLFKILKGKNRNLIIDLPVSSTFDPNGLSWYGSTNSLKNPIKNPCRGKTEDLGCQYYEAYGRLPLDFNQDIIASTANDRIREWLSTKKFDGVRVDIPLQYNKTISAYEISFSTIDQWQKTKTEIEKTGKAKLILFDIPTNFKKFVINDQIQNYTAHSLFVSTDVTRSTRLTGENLDQRLKSFEMNDLAKPKYWRLSSKRKSDENGVLNDQQLSKEMSLTLVMLIGGTPILLNGDELGLNSKDSILMPWSSDGRFNGFTNCSSTQCLQRFSNYNSNSVTTSVKRQEASGAGQEPMLTFYRRLAQLREKESFQYGILETGAHEDSNLFWFIREAPGHRGYITVFNLNDKSTEAAHISLYRLTSGHVPEHIHYEYQWPQAFFPTTNTTPINSDNLLIPPQSISIFWWKEKAIQPKILFAKAKEHHEHHH